MSNSTRIALAKKLFTRRQNCLLVNVSSKRDCDTRFDFRVLSRILPALSRWCRATSQTYFPNHTLITLCCTNTISEDVVLVGDLEEYQSKFRHSLYLVRSNMLMPYNISLLRTTMERLLIEDLEEAHFNNLIFLDFYNWHTDSFRRYYQQLKMPFSVAIMDGFNKTAYTEKDTRQQEIDEICKQYADTEGIRCRSVVKSFNYADFAYLNTYLFSKRRALEKQLKQQLITIAGCFGRSGENLWWEVVHFEGMNNLSASQIAYSTENIIEHCVLRSLNTLLDKEEFELFCCAIPNWKCKLEGFLNAYNWKKINANKLASISEKVIGKEFAKYVVVTINQILQ